MSTGGSTPWVPTSPIWLPRSEIINPAQWVVWRAIIVALLRRWGLLPLAPPDEDEPPFASVDAIRSAAVAYAPSRVGEIDHYLGLAQSTGISVTVG